MEWVNTYRFYPPHASLACAYGKWLVFCFKRDIDTLWQKLHPIIDVLSHTNTVLCMKVSTSQSNPHVRSDMDVIMIYTREEQTFEQAREQILSVGQYLLCAFNDRQGFQAPRQFSPFARMYYKTEAQSKLGSRMSGRKQGNTLTSIRLPDWCVENVNSEHDNNWTMMSQPKPTKQSAPIHKTLTPMELHRMGAVWEPTSDNWLAPNDKVLHTVLEFAKQQSTEKKHSLDTFTCLSMNIWGNMDTFVNPQTQDECSARLDEICRLIEAKQPDIVCLQEVQDSQFVYMEPLILAQGYVLATRAPDRGTCCFAHTMTINVQNVQNISPNSTLAIDLLCFMHKNTLLDCALVNVHLPATAKCASLRLLLLQHLFLTLQSTQRPWILIGDMNLTSDQEPMVDALATHPIQDAWVATGSAAETRMTFDCSKNSNLQGRKRDGCRFDRAYFDSSKLNVSAFQLTGTDVIPRTNRHPSDHFGIFVTFCL